MLRLGLQVLWPAFMMAGVAEALVFAAVDPLDLHPFGAPALDWPRAAVYSVGFLILWIVIATSAALTLLLVRSSDGPPDDPF